MKSFFVDIIELYLNNNRHRRIVTSQILARDRHMPDDQVTFSQRRKMILGNIIKAAVEKRLITIPEEFNRGLDYVTPISFYFWETDSPDFHLNRGFPGTVNTNKFTLNEEYDGSNPTREATFAGYALLSLYYTPA